MAVKNRRAHVRPSAVRARNSFTPPKAESQNFLRWIRDPNTHFSRANNPSNNSFRVYADDKQDLPLPHDDCSIASAATGHQYQILGTPRGITACPNLDIHHSRICHSGKHRVPRVDISECGNTWCLLICRDCVFEVQLAEYGPFSFFRTHLALAYVSPSFMHNI